MIPQYSVWIFLNRFFSSFVFFRPPQGGRFFFDGFYDFAHRILAQNLYCYEKYFISYFIKKTTHVE